MRILFINGWGGLIQSLQVLKNALEKQGHQVDVIDYVNVFDDHSKQQMMNMIQPYEVIAGWSLGGQIATILAHTFYQQYAETKILWTLFSNPCFIQRDGWETAQNPEQFEQFKQRFITQPDKTLQRFLLAMLNGDKDIYHQVAIYQQEYLQLHQTHLLLGLEILQQLDTVNILEQYTGTQIHFYAQHDHLAPIEIVQKLVNVQAQWAYFDGHFDVYLQANAIAQQFTEMIKKSVSI